MFDNALNLNLVLFVPSNWEHCLKSQPRPQDLLLDNFQNGGSSCLKCIGFIVSLVSIRDEKKLLQWMNLYMTRKHAFFYFANFKCTFLLNRERPVRWTLCMAKDRFRSPFIRVGNVQWMQVMAMHFSPMENGCSLRGGQFIILFWFCNLLISSLWYLWECYGRFIQRQGTLCIILQRPPSRFAHLQMFSVNVTSP